MITPPSNTIDNSATPDDSFIWRHITGEQFLAKRLRVGDDGVAPHYHPHSDRARLRNIVHFLTDFKDTLPSMDPQWWTFDNASEIRRERLALFDLRHTANYRMGNGMFDQHSDRASPMFLPAAQQDLVVLTLEILARVPVADTAPPQRVAFNVAFDQLTQVISILADEHMQEQALARAPALQLQPSTLLRNMRANNGTLVTDFLEMVKRALEPILQTLATD
ncbi:hypothetical protein EDB84DRAFT_1136944 [Lactarius hengduanensis]|nr:hypothetical protein EDB84DRAFT_1136944 [Lactarius hengduanensis]